jgi:hypothetical protein
VKKISLLLLVVAVAFGVGDTVGQAGSEEDAIKKAALDYCEGWYAGDAERMESCLHPQLAKRVVRRDPESGRVTLVNMSALELVQATRKGWGAKVPKEGQQKDIEILDVFGNVASVRATMSGWIDYMHLAKWNGRWVIVNVLWEPKPEEG